MSDMKPTEVTRTTRPARVESTRFTRVMRVGSVSFLNAKPLIHGLEGTPGIDLHLEVPSKLLAGLQEGRLDAALLPVIDYQRMAGLRVLTAGGIGCMAQSCTSAVCGPRPTVIVAAAAW